MNDPLAGLRTVIADIESAWPATLAGGAAGVSELSEVQLIAANAAAARLRRQVEELQAKIACEIARQSRPERGKDGLAKKNGFRTPVTLIATTTGITHGDAVKLVAVGDATAPRVTLTGEEAPAKHPHVAAAFEAGRIGMQAAAMIVRMLDRVAMRAEPAKLDSVEKILATQAADLSLDDLAKVVARAEAHLAPDGLEPKERELRGQRALRMFRRDGLLHLNAVFDPESGLRWRLRSKRLSPSRCATSTTAVPRPAATGIWARQWGSWRPPRDRSARWRSGRRMPSCRSCSMCSGATVRLRSVVPP